MTYDHMHADYKASRKAITRSRRQYCGWVLMTTAIMLLLGHALPSCTPRAYAPRRNTKPASIGLSLPQPAEPGVSTITN